MTTTSDSFANRLRQTRENQRLSKSELARKLGISTTGVWNWEEGNTTPRPENLIALSKVLNVTVTYLQKGSELDKALPAQAASETPNIGNTLAEVIDDAKKRIARLAGIQPEKVNVSLDY